jgi:DNA-binding transcriptional LysR family regulator
MSETIELDSLAVFVAVAETMSFTRAAARLGTTKATVSRAIAKLEAIVGAELVHRTTRSVALSTAGTALYERVAPHVAALRGVVGSLPESETLAAGELRITAPFDFGAIVLPDVIATFGLRYPAVRVDVHLTNDVVDLVAGRFDLAIRGAGGKLKSSSLTVRRLATLSMAAYAAPSYVSRRAAPRTLGDPEHDWAMHAAIMRAVRFPPKTSPKVSSNDLFFLREAIRSGMYVGVLPSFVAEPLVALGELTRVLTIRSQPGGLVLLYPSSGQVARKVTAFRDVLLETLRARPLPS